MAVTVDDTPAVVDPGTPEQCNMTFCFQNRQQIKYNGVCIRTAVKYVRQKVVIANKLTLTRLSWFGVLGKECDATLFLWRALECCF